MNRPRVFITGVQHSGTTWCAAVLNAAGYDLGTDLHHAGGVSRWHGKEFRPAFELLTHAVGQLGTTCQRTGGYWWPPEQELANREECVERLGELDWPELVKVPGSGPACFWGAIDPDFVVVMTRDPDAWAASMSREPHMRVPLSERPDVFRSATRDILERTVDWPHTVVHFEHAAADPEVAWNQLSGVPGLDRETLLAAHGQATVPEWVGQSAR